MKFEVFIGIIAVFLLLSACTPNDMMVQNTPLSDGVIAGAASTDNIIEAWYLDENTGTTAYGNKSVLNLNLASSSLWNSTGYNGSGIYLNPSVNAKLQATMVSGLSPGTYSEQLWCMRFKWKTQVSNSSQNTILHMTNNNDTFEFSNRYPNTEYHMHFRVYSSANVRQSVTYFPWIPPVGVWQSYCVGYNTTHVVMYENATLIQSASATGAKKSYVGDLLAIGEGAYNGGDVNGYIDEIVVFNETSQDIVDYYENMTYKGGGSSPEPPVTDCYGDNVGKGLSYKRYTNGTYEWIGGTGCKFESSDVS